MKIICTCSGGEFNEGHVQALAKQCAQHAPEHEFICITHMKVPGVKTLPRTNMSWAGWWVEMEMFHPSIEGPILYLDIDTVIIGSMADIMAQTELTVLRDAYRGRRDPKAIQDSVMMLPEAVRPAIWEDWNRATSAHRGRNGAMQALFQDHWREKARFWQDVLPGQFASFKVDGVSGKDLRVVFFHGTPRPWRVATFAHLYA